MATAYHSARAASRAAGLRSTLLLRALGGGAAAWTEPNEGAAIVAQPEIALSQVIGWQGRL